MRDIVWQQIDGLLPTGPANLIDLGCGTGIDAQHFAELGHHVTATDWSPAMVERAAARAAVVRPGTIEAVRAGSQQLDLLAGTHARRFHVAYSNFGPLNCVPDLGDTARQLGELMRPGGYALFTVIGRWCPWEFAYVPHDGEARRRDGVAAGLPQHGRPLPRRAAQALNPRRTLHLAGIRPGVRDESAPEAVSERNTPRNRGAHRRGARCRGWDRRPNLGP